MTSKRAQVIEPFLAVEIFERAQMGMLADVNPWVEISRGMNREVKDEDGTIVGLITDEVTQRGQARKWRELMTQAN